METTKRKWHEPEYKETTEPPGQGAEPAPARSCLLLQLSCTEPAESNPNPLKFSLALPGWRSLIQHCFMLITVLHPLAKLCPPFTVIWHLPNVSHTLENDAVGTGLWETSRISRAGTSPLEHPTCWKLLSQTQQPPAEIQQKSCYSSQDSCWEAVPSLTTRAV